MARKLVRLTPELAEEICHEIATRSLGLPELCKMFPHWPNQNTIHEWRYKFPDFGDKYAKAKQCQIDVLTDEILYLTNDTSHDFYEDSKGEKCPHTPHLTRLRYRIDSIKWLACKLAPKVYGDKQHNETEISLHEKNLRDLE